MKINIVKKKGSNSTKVLIGLMLFVLTIEVLRQNQLFFNSRPHDYFITSTPDAISHHNNQGVEKSKSKINCDRSHYSYDLCSINGPTIFDPIKSTFYDMDSTNNKNETNIIVEKIRPYPRKWENYTMGSIKEFTLNTGPIGPHCLIHHKAQALVFSVGGYTGNFFHDINDGFIPLFITVNSLFPNQDFILVISKLQDWWVHKYKDLLQSFSKHPIINIDKEVNVTHCFPRVTIGLMSHGFMNIDPKLTPTSKTLIDFHKFLATTYGTSKSQRQSHHQPQRQSQSHHQPQPQFSPQIQYQSRPRLVLASRGGSIGRLILNQDEVRLVAEQIGFEVLLFEPKKTTSLHESFGLIHSSHAMIGVHGAALTHALFLRPSSIFIQIVPIGAEGVSDICFGKLAREMKLVYEEYKIGVEESSLMEKFGKENKLVLKNPKALQGKGWSQEIMDIYLRQQNINLNLNKFRMYLEKAYQNAKIFKAING
ncbi:xylan glycosyltransferase MUCI21 [Solanum dulcamara]|uniref:xylan glycosyltransferase MUCI21 n=1 Tax=Solanum dulcamara TaxID=45834 RepID=UPI002485674B|nr:xylan glycosyltransferase MUCI21 [Solanum dulcamara]